MKPTRSTLTLVGTVFMAGVLFFVKPGLVDQFGLDSGWFSFPLGAYALFTYSFLPGPFVTWLLNCGALFISGFLIEPFLGGRVVWLTAIVASVGGGITFLVLSTRGVLVGSAQMAWGLSGAMFIFGLREWKTLRWLARLYIIWIFIAFVVTIAALRVTESSIIDLTDLVACVLGVGIASVTLVWRRQRPNNRLQATVGGGLAVDSGPGSPTAPEPER